MAYYDALVAKWPSLTGTPIQKLATLNAMTQTGSVPTVFTVRGADLLNCIAAADLAALTASQQTLVLTLCQIAANTPVHAGTGSFMQTVFLSLFGPATATRTALTALAKAVTQPWWEANGYLAPINLNDLAAAGGLI